MTEKQWMQLVIDAARLLNWCVYHTHDSRRSEPGWPDLVAIRKAPMIAQPSTIIVAELKTERGRLTPAQRHWLDLFESCGIRAYVWRPSQWDEVEATLRGEG